MSPFCCIILLLSPFGMQNYDHWLMSPLGLEVFLPKTERYNFRHVIPERYIGNKSIWPKNSFLTIFVDEPFWLLIGDIYKGKKGRVKKISVDRNGT